MLAIRQNFIVFQFFFVNPPKLSGKIVAYLMELTMQWQQNLWPQLVCTGSRSPKWQRGHLYLLSKGGSKYSSYPSELGSTSFDDKPSSAEVSVPLVADMGLVWETSGKIAGQSVLLSALGDDHPATYHHKSSLWSYVTREYWQVGKATNVYKKLRLS